MEIAIVGAGTAGTAVGVAWDRAGHRIVAATGRAATAQRVATWLPATPVGTIAEGVATAEVVAIAVPDDALPTVVAEVATAIAPGTWVLHLSGAHGLGVLDPVVAAGGRVLALHPLQTFADVVGALAALGDCAVAVTAVDADGYAMGKQLATDLGGRPFRLSDAERPLYHAAAVFASNYLVAVSGAAETLLSLAGVPDALGAMRPLQEATLANVYRLGPPSALTGPTVRADVGTIERNLQALADAAPQLVAAYVELSRLALLVAGDRLSSSGRASVEEVLAAWS